MGCAVPLMTILVSWSCISDFPVKRRALADFITLPRTGVPLGATTIPFATRFESSVAEKRSPVLVLPVSRLSTMRTVIGVPAKTVTDVGLEGGGPAGGGGAAAGTAKVMPSTSATEYVL